MNPTILAILPPSPSQKQRQGQGQIVPSFCYYTSIQDTTLRLRLTWAVGTGACWQITSGHNLGLGSVPIAHPNGSQLPFSSLSIGHSLLQFSQTRSVPGLTPQRLVFMLLVLFTLYLIWHDLFRPFNFCLEKSNPSCRTNSNTASSPQTLHPQEN